MLTQIVCGWLFADLLSGFFHWWEDRVGWEAMPLLGGWVIVPNREHHTDPLAFTYASIWQRNRVVWLITLLVAAAWFLLAGPSWFLAATALGGLVVNEVHVLAHDKRRTNRLTRALQEAGIIQSAAHHARHHRGVSDSHYCILTDLLNPVLDMVGLWAGLEWLLTALGLEPNRGTA